jgi:hypothetical protein
MYHSAFSDGRFGVREQLADCDFVVTRSTGIGTHDGDLMGMPPSRKSVEIAGITIDRIADDKCVESWTCFDTLGMMQQLGAVPEPQPAGVRVAAVVRHTWAHTTKTEERPRSLFA